jgi:Secretion system C-terminal sorting domain
MVLTQSDVLQPMAAQRDWIAQYGVWNAVKADSTLVGASPKLNAFAGMAGSSRYKYLTDLGLAVGSADYTTAAAMLCYAVDPMANIDTDYATGVVMQDATAADAIVSNYREYYRLLMNYTQGVMTATDSTYLVIMANMCPYVDGAVIYEARALYSLVYQDPRMFNDVGCEANDQGAVWDSTCQCFRKANGDNKSDAPLAQAYKLYPNPNDGSFLVQQLYPDNTQAEVSIYDAMGNLVLRRTAGFQNGLLPLDVTGTPPGIYLLQLLDGKGRTSTIKFTIQ